MKLKLRAFLAVGAFLLVLESLPFVFAWLENTRCRREWESYNRRLTAQGEQLDFAALIPSQIPDEKNFAMTRLLKPLLDDKSSRKNGDVVRRDELPVGKIDVFMTGAHSNMPKLATWVSGRPFDYHELEAYFLSGSAGLKASGRPEETVLAVFGKFDAEIAELRDEAARRPLSRIPLKYEEGYAMSFEYATCVMSVEKVIALRAGAELHLGRGADAMEDIRFAFRLMDSVANQPVLPLGTDRCLMLTFAMQPVWEGIVAHRWTDGQLAQIETALRQLDFLRDYGYYLRADRAYINWIFSKLCADSGRPVRLLTPWSNLERDFESMRGKWTCDGIVYHDLAALNRIVQEDLLPVADAGRRRFDCARQETNEGLLPTYQAKGRVEFIVNGLLSEYVGLARYFAAAEVNADEALIACEIERYRLAHGTLPATLEALQTQGLPHDIMNGQPLHYKLDGVDNYLLYSVGLNGMDDGGTVVFKPGTTYIRYDKGDWVWSLKPL